MLPRSTDVKYPRPAKTPRGHCTRMQEREPAAVMKAGSKSFGALRHAAHRTNPLLILRHPPLLHIGREAREIEARRRETGIARAVFDETVRYADMMQRQLDALGSEKFAYT